MAVTSRWRFRYSDLLAVAAVLLLASVFVVDSLRPELSTFSDPARPRTFFLPLVLYSYSPISTIGAIFLSAACALLWFLSNPDRKALTWVGLCFTVLMLFCGICGSLTAYDDEFDLFSVAPSLHPEGNRTYGSRTYEFVLIRGVYGYEGGLLFECNSRRWCRTMMRLRWGTERMFWRQPRYFLFVDQGILKLAFGTKILAEYPLPAAS